MSDQLITTHKPDRIKTYSEQTAGERAVRADFNPSKEGNVAHIKRQFANIYDFIDEMEEDITNKIKSANTGATADEDITQDYKLDELWESVKIAKESIMTACMYAVKAATT